MSTVAQPTPTHLPWKVRGTSIYFADVAGGFDVRNCPDPENLAAYIHLACNSFDALTEANARQLEAITQAHKLLGALRPIDIQNATVRDSVGAAYCHLGALLKVTP